MLVEPYIYIYTYEYICYIEAIFKDYMGFLR